MSFPSNNTILNQVVQIKEVQAMKASANCTAIGATIVGVSTAVGGLLGGRIGLALGRVISSTLVASYASSDLVSGSKIIMDMSREVKAKLVKAIYNLAKRSGVKIMRFLAQVACNESFLGGLLGLLTNFLVSVMDMHVQYVH